MVLYNSMHWSQIAIAKKIIVFIRMHADEVFNTNYSKK